MAIKVYDFNPVTDIPSQEGKVILITGANTGIGKQTALELAKHGPAHIFMASRNVEKGDAAAAEARSQATTGTQVSNLELDLSSFESIRKAVKSFLAVSERLDILYLNAGVLGVPAALTKEGYEIQMGTNHVGHAVLLKLLTPILLKTAATGAKPRVLSVASLGYKYCNPPQIAFDSLKTVDAPIEGVQRYTQSKLANVLYARQFAARHPDITTVSLNPGEVDTLLFKREAADDGVKHLQTAIAPAAVGPIEEGVKNHLWVGTNEKVQSGEFYNPVGEAGQLESPGTDDEMAKKLWEWTAQELEQHGI
ncbi:hypothetical protein B0J13DRAFT_608793 [Dactylonectria estremocensis]|uniref:Uncharacterized protein n=1 Tax=Dactylonectria estremocensis TaxID=1079267 RepID=A0A9P9ENT5_9HYPO|nr:hypothetical protein B0J13DRAFT_608793 [Dactylonectria estremocensis]